MHKPRILLVDDEMRYLTTTQKLMSRQGIEVLIADSGKTALKLLSENIIHVVILDVKMPEMDGMATLSFIKQRHPMVEVIMLTGHATVESAIEGLKAGATDYLMKPADIEELTEKAMEAFERRKRIEEKIRHAECTRSMHTPA